MPRVSYVVFYVVNFRKVWHNEFVNCQVCLKNKGISSLYAMKRCSAGECTNGRCHIEAMVENSGPSRIYIHYIYIPEYISISQGYQRARSVIIYINEYMDPLKGK